MTVQIALFLFGTAALAWLSRDALRDPRSHGFYRFFAWVAILALLVQNAAFWFEDQFAPHQLVSSLLLFSSLGVLIAGVVTLRAKGGASGESRHDPALFAFEETTTLVTSGIFGHIRHPLYSSLLLLAWGIFFKQPTVAGLLCAVLATLLLVITARRDEAECIEFFGEPYRHYMTHTRRFIPWLY